MSIHAPNEVKNRRISYGVDIEVNSLLKALESLDFPSVAKPSLFLTDDGHFELAWRDTEGRSIQIEFGPNEFELFVEGTGIEVDH